jgi:hypothetical protein
MTGSTTILMQRGRHCAGLVGFRHPSRQTIDSDFSFRSLSRFSR